MNIQRGFRDKLEKYANPNQEMTVEMQTGGNAVYDYCCFGVDAAGKLSDERYMVFYNQVSAPNREITYTDANGKAQFNLRLSQLPAAINKLVFTVSIDGNGTMGQITSHTLRIVQNGQTVAELNLTGRDFHEEKAIISMEIYRKDVWRFAAVASGFNGGLGDLLRAYGGEESDEDTAAPAAHPTPAAPAYNNTPSQNNAMPQNPAMPSPYNNSAVQNNTASQNPAMPSPYNNSAVQNNTASQNPAMPSPYNNSAVQNNTASQNPAMPSQYNNNTASNNAAQQGVSQPSTYAVPVSQSGTPQNLAPPPTYSLPTPQSSMPQNLAPPPTYSIPTPQGSMPQNMAPPPMYSAANTQAPSAAPAQEVYTQPQVQNQYGQAPAQNPYGQPQTQNPYGQPQAQNQYGQAPMQDPYGGMSAAPTQQSGKISLEKKLQTSAPGLVSLAKPLKVELEKRNLQDCVARVALVLDISGSMTRRYKEGVVQDIVNKTLPLAVQFDDNGELDFWYYGDRCRRMPSVTMQNYTNAVPPNWKDIMHDLGGCNNEPVVMKEVLSEYKKSRLPAYVLFITDGGVSSESSIRKILKDASKHPIFWQFVGVGGSNYGILERLDTMKERFIDNAGFFALDDFMSVSTSELYGRLLNEFPVWLDAAKRSRILK